MSDFERAQKDVHSLSKKPSQADLLVLYANFKQATEGDAKGARPGMLNVTGRLKYDAWAKLAGTQRADAEAAYVAKVKALLAAEGK
jgi:diazepam-binding inhibitor (GABA receptor modulator, acyl-CoA-binding protein)